MIGSGEKVDLSYFDAANSSKNVIRIKPVYFLILLVVLIAFVILILIGRRVYDNFYLIRHKLSAKKEQRERYKQYKRMKRRKTNLSFRGKKKY